MEGWRVVEMDEMRNFVRHNAAAHVVWSHYQPPVDADAAIAQTMAGA